MITVKTQSPEHNGIVRRRYEVTLTDVNGEIHTEIVGIFNHSVDNDGAEVKGSLWLSKKAQEVEQYKSDIRNNQNPFLVQSVWNTRAELLKEVLTEALSSPPTDSLVFYGVPLLEHIPDEELMALFDQNQAWVDNARLKAQDLLTAISTLDNYKAVL